MIAVRVESFGEILERCALCNILSLIRQVDYASNPREFSDSGFVVRTDVMQRR